MVLAAKSDPDAADALISQYMGFIRAEAKKLSFGDGEDELSVAMLAFYEAALGYERSRGSFLSFAARVIRSRLIDYNRAEMREAAQSEIEEFSRALAAFGITFSDVADNCPKQARTLRACMDALNYARRNPEVLAAVEKSGKLPIAELASGAGIERKTLERHRKYMGAAP